jgi:hypothetical protein
MLSISTAQVDQIWDALIVHAITEDERDFCFLWLRRLCKHADEWLV